MCMSYDFDKEGVICVILYVSNKAYVPLFIYQKFMTCFCCQVLFAVLP